MNAFKNFAIFSAANFPQDFVIVLIAAATSRTKTGSEEFILPQAEAQHTALGAGR
jgi:hypothetical protein